MTKKIRRGKNFSSVLENLFGIKSFLIFFSLFFIVFAGIGFLAHWNASEIYPVHTAQYLFSKNMSSYLFSMKSLYNFLLFLSFYFSDLFSVFPMTVARMLFALNGCLLMALLFVLVRKKTDSLNAFLAVFLFVGSQIFLERGFRVRSDLLVSTFTLFSVYLAMERDNKNLWRFVYMVLFFAGSLLISPKAVYWLLFAGVLLANELKKQKLPKFFFREAFLSVCFIFLC